MAFQLLAFKKILKLRDLSLVNIGSVHKSSDLRRRLSVLSLEDLRDVVCSKIVRIFLTEVVVSSFEKHSGLICQTCWNEWSSQILSLMQIISVKVFQIMRYLSSMLMVLKLWIQGLRFESLFRRY